MALRAAFFDVGDTLVEHWAPRDAVNERARARVCGEMGEQAWLDELLEARIEPATPTSWAQAIAGRSIGEGRFEPAEARQETARWYREWFDRRGITTDGIDMARLLSLMCVPLEDISSPVRGALDAVRWCAEQGMRVVLVTNTLTRGDVEVLEDWRRFGIGHAIHGVVSSHSVGWRKPHPAIFERALEIADAKPNETFHVGDNLIADVWGAQQVGIRGIWRRSPRTEPPTDERGEPTRRRDLAEPEKGPEVCGHPSQDLYLSAEIGSEVRCGSCERIVDVDVRPDAIVDDLTELEAAVMPWMAARVR